MSSENTLIRTELENNAEPQIFEHPQFGKIRIVTIQGEPWMVGKDVAVALGYEKPANAIATHVDEEDKKMGPQNGVPSITDSLGRTQYPIWINESGLYSLVLSSKLPTAKQFKRWVTSEVLPSIRKHGAYLTPDALQAAISDPSFGIRILTALKEERDKNTLMQNVIEEMQPKADYCDLVLSCQDPIATTVIAKDYGWSAQRLNKYLESKRVQYKRNGTWVLHARYAGRDYTKTVTFSYKDSHGEPHSNIQTYWTQAVRMLIYDLLRHDHILPCMERSAALPS